MRSTIIQERAGIFIGNSAAGLQSARKRSQGSPRRTFISRPEHDYVSTRETVALVEFREPRARLIGDKVRARTGKLFVERTADNLLHLAFVKIDARPEHADSA